MKKITKNPFLREILTSRFSIYNASATFVALILVRLSMEMWIAKFEHITPYFYFYETLHTGFFFFLLFIICVTLITKITKISLQKSTAILLFGFIIIIFPPIIDWIISSLFFDDMSFKSYYLFDSIGGLSHRFIAFFGDKPYDGVTYGTRIMIGCALLLFGTITYIKTKEVTRAAMIMLFAYIIFFLLSAFPSLITFVFSSAHFSAHAHDVAGFIATPHKILGNKISDPISAINIKMSLVYMLLSTYVTLFILYRTHKETLLALLKNIRPIQTLYHLGLLSVGVGIAVMFGGAVILPSFFTCVAWLLLCTAIVMAWYSTVIFNDYVDQDIDRISNPHRPLIQNVINPKSYKHIGILLAMLSVIFTAAVSPPATLLLIGYHALSFLYNTPPLRLKRFPFIATLLAALASFFIVALGFVTVTPEHSLTGFPPHIALLLIVAYTISLPIKDLKDLKGDKKNNIYTIPVLFGEKTGRLLIGIGVFASFILSIFALNNFALFFPALLAGSLCFWIITGTKKERFTFAPLSTITLVFTVVFIYGIILTISLFL